MTTMEQQRGSVLISGVLAIFVIASLSAALMTTVFVEDQRSRTNHDIVTGNFEADGAAEIAEKVILYAIAHGIDLQPGEEMEFTYDDEDGNPANDVTFTCKMERVLDDPGDPDSGLEWEVVTPDGVWTLVQPWLIEGVANVNGYQRRVHRIVNVGIIFLFHYAVFYDGDLEILPKPAMTIRGRVHTNGDMYLGSDSLLTFTSHYVRAVGDIYRARKDTLVPTTGQVLFKVRGEALHLPMESRLDLLAQGIPSVSGLDSNFDGYDMNGDGDYIDFGELSPWAIEAIERWNGTVQSSYHGLREYVAPNIRSIKRFVRMEQGTGGDWERDEITGEYYRVPVGTGHFRQGYYHGKADLVILDNEIFDSDGSSIPLPPGILAERSFYDAREGQYVTVTELDLQALAATPAWPANGLIYAARTDANAANPNGIRLANGSTLATALTVVSEDPVYVKGDYNTVDKKGAAVIGDAVSVLSNSWDDSKAPGTLPTATNTTVNAAIVAGAYESSAGDYNGGFENLVRFHENWTGIDCNIVGSFVNIYNSQIATAPWVYGGDKYLAPNRNFEFDIDFRDVENLPPYTPRIAHVRNSVWFEKAY